MREPGRVFSRDTLLALFSGEREKTTPDRRVDVHVSALRAKLARAMGGESPIRTVRGMGYALPRTA